MIQFTQRIPLIFGLRKAIETLITSAKENTWSRAHVRSMFREDVYLLIESGSHAEPQFAFLYDNGAVIRVDDLTKGLRFCTVSVLKDARVPSSQLTVSAKDRIETRAVWCLDHPEDSWRILYVRQVAYDTQYLTAVLHKDWHNSFKYQLHADDVWCGLDAVNASRVSTIL